MMTIKPKKILIATPTFPPEIGGSALYADILSKELRTMSYKVSVVKYGILKKFPIIIKHLAYSLKILPSVISADFVIVLDSFLVAIPVIFISRMFGKKVIVRIGGDFLWEEYTERTKETILLSEFYKEKRNFSFKEKCIFVLTKYFIEWSTCVVFSTTWQRGIFVDAYGLDMSKTSVIENVYVKGNQRNIIPKNKIILAPARNIFLKNKINLEKAFNQVKQRFIDVTLDTKIGGHGELRDRIMSAYCVVVPSFSEVSPNTVLEALALGVPAVVTEDCGLKDLLENLVVWVNPKNPQSIASGIEKLMDANVYNEYMAEISKFTYSQTPRQIAHLFLNLFENI